MRLEIGTNFATIVWENIAVEIELQNTIFHLVILFCSLKVMAWTMRSSRSLLVRVLRSHRPNSPQFFECEGEHSSTNLLATASLVVENSEGQKLVVKALVDPCNDNINISCLINHLWSNIFSQFMRELMAELSLKLIATGPSQNAPIKDSWINIILTDECDFIFDFDSRLPAFPSRHDIISITINTFRPVQLTTTYTYRRNIRKITPSDLRSIDKLTPEKTENPRKSIPPWISTHSHLLIRKRDATGRRYARTGSRQQLTEFLRLAEAVEE